MKALVVCLILLWSFAAQATTYVVDDLGDNGDNTPGDDLCDTGSAVCTLRAAIQEANAHSGADVIHFTVSGTTTAASLYPAIIEQVTIEDTRTNCGNILTSNTVPAPAFVITCSDDFLVFELVANGSTIKGLKITSCSSVVQASGDNEVVQCNLFWDNPKGWAVEMRGVSALVGGPSAGDGNVVANGGTDSPGYSCVFVHGADGGATSTIQGNWFGTKDGTTAAGCGAFGIHNTGNGSTIDRNVISANTRSGIMNSGGITSGTITRNKIGTDWTGMLALGNGDSGVGIADFDGGASNIVIGGSGAGNVICSNVAHGVELTSVAIDTVLDANLIGRNADNSADLCNGSPQVLDNGSGTTGTNIIGESCEPTPTPTVTPAPTGCAVFSSDDSTCQAEILALGLTVVPGGGCSDTAGPDPMTDALAEFLRGLFNDGCDFGGGPNCPSCISETVDVSFVAGSTCAEDCEAGGPTATPSLSPTRTITATRTATGTGTRTPTKTPVPMVVAAAGAGCVELNATPQAIGESTGRRSLNFWTIGGTAWCGYDLATLSETPGPNSGAKYIAGISVGSCECQDDPLYCIGDATVCWDQCAGVVLTPTPTVTP